MSEERLKISGEIFRSILTHMDTLSRKELIELKDGGKTVEPGHHSPAYYYVVLALEDLARVELVNRDLIGECDKSVCA